jgi:hypothetical protein
VSTRRPGIRDAYPRHLDRTATGAHALVVGGCEAGANYVDNQINLEAVSYENRLGATIGVAGEQFERAAALGIGFAASNGHACSSFVPRSFGASIGAAGEDFC